ncbi:malate synthase A [Lewinella cohaerens]|uniref:malate synthase A n=1 Tax=Lewinella cohaerens TaxID=70995 RepID=UPI00036C1BC3|nr:malate synthase A [Lewinella cohaerens]
MPNQPSLAALTIQAPSTKTISERVLTPAAMSFLEALHLRFNDRRKALLQQRVIRQKAIDEGVFPRFSPETLSIRESDWKVGPLPLDLLDRRVEITGPVNRKMVINALNSGAKVFMADFEDSNTPSWDNNMNGQLNLQDAILGTISYEHPKTGKLYCLNPQTATLMIRPRGWHLEEKNLHYKNEALSGSLVDFGLYFFHNAKTLIDQGSGPYFYLPKLEGHHEAKLWNDVFLFAQSYLDIPVGTIKATVLIETILAAFEMDEILYELREHSAGLNCGRWDYIFSFIKKFKQYPDRIMPDRSQVTMTAPFMKAYCDLLIKTCHRRGVHAMGGMAAQIPIKNKPVENSIALEKVYQDKLREVLAGHDGSWVAHPGLVSLAKDVFDEHMPQANQIDNIPSTAPLVEADDLLAVPKGTITEEGLRENIRVGILYLESWLNGNGAAALFYKMEDAATAEISRTQLWQWIKHSAQMEDGQQITYLLYQQLLQEELPGMEAILPNDNKLETAIKLFDQLVKEETFTDFLTLPAYQLL